MQRRRWFTSFSALIGFGTKHRNERRSRPPEGERNVAFASALGQTRFELIFSIAFRAFYIAGVFWAVTSIAIRVFGPGLAAGQLGGLAWHAHEMRWGLVATIALGFLRIASATWSGINPMNGGLLAATCLLWGRARACFLVRTPLASVMASICEHSFLACTAIALVPVVITPRSRRTVDVPSCWRALHGGRFFQFAVTQNDIGLASQRLDAGLLSMAVIALLVGRRVIPFFAKRVVDGLKISLYESSAAWPWAARNRPRPWLL